jgi:type II secretory pathway pseudopilin PulG
MIEMLAGIAIIAIIAALVFVFVGNYVDYSRLTAARHTVAVLNEGLNEYRALGGLRKGYSMPGSSGSTLNVSTLTSAAIEGLRNGFNNNGNTVGFIQPKQALDTSAIASTGGGARFRFVVDESALSSGGVSSKSAQNAVSISASSTSVTTGDAVTLTASGGSGSGAYIWSATSGTFSATTGESVTITFSSAGNYTVSLYKASDSTYAVSNTATTSIIAESITALPSTNLLWCLQSDTNVTTSGTEVTQWATTDGSLTFEPYNSTKRPILDTSIAIGGISPIYFTNDLCTSTTTPSLPTGASARSFATLVMCGSNATRNNCDVWSYGGATSTNAYVSLMPRYETSSYWAFGTYGNMAAGSTTSSIASTPQLLICTYDGATAKLYLGSTLLKSNTITLATTSSAFSLGGWLKVAYLNGGVYSHELSDGRVWEIAVWSKALSTNEIAQVISHVNSKYGLSIQ